MSADFDAIRPYDDSEVPGVIANLLGEPQVIDAAVALGAPAYLRWLPPLARWLTRRKLERLFAGIASVAEFQRLISGYFQRMVEASTDGFTFEGVDRLEREHAYLFVSNHRDISMDSGFMNYALHRSGLETSRIAIGDNLIRRPYATDLMRLNKSFIVQREFKGTKSAYAALLLQSRYIRHSLNEGASIWIAQASGRAKDGFDRTDPALLKMFALAYRKELEDFAQIVPRLALLPVSITYEVDPCDTMKAHELAMRERHGEYRKPEDEDLRSIAAGITGYKGRVHLVFGSPLLEPLPDAEAVAAALDREIVANLRIFPTHRYAARCLEARELLPVPDGAGKAVRTLAACAAAAPEEERDYLLAQYANVIANKRELGVEAVEAHS